MNRREFIGAVAAAAMTKASGAQGRVGGSALHPNILWVVTEDNTRYYDGPYGDPCAHTPRIDRLAADGIVFDNSHSVAPVCAPSRTAIITGCYSSCLGTQHMRSGRPLPPDVRFFPEYLRKAGYFTTNHVKTDYNTSYPFERAWDMCNAAAHWRHRRPGQPFFSVFNFMESHESKLFVRQPLQVDPAKVKIPPYLPDVPEVRADIAQYYDCVGRADAALGRILDQLKQDGLEEETIVFYYADHGGSCPRSKRFLYDNGTHTPMVIRFPEKFRHLAPAAPGTRSREMLSYVDLAPTVLSLTGIPAPAYFQGRAFAGPARRPAPKFVHVFRGRMDERIDFSCGVGDGRFRYVRNYMPYRPAGQHIAYLWNEASMRRTDELNRAGRLDPAQRAFFEPRAAEELFDCDADPHNVNNLAGSPAHAETLARLRSENRAHMLRIRDTGFLPEAMMIAESGKDSPALVARDDARYPLEQLLDLADGCQLRGEAARRIPTALADSRPVVRYWAAACALSVANAPDVSALVDDPDPSVRVVAAETVLRRGSDAKAWRRLGEALAPGQAGQLWLAALNALTFLPRGPEEICRRVRELAQPGDEAEEVANPGNAYGGRAAEYLVSQHLA